VLLHVGWRWRSEQSYERGSALMNNRILVRVNTQFLCQVVGHHLMPIGLHAFGLRSDGSSATWSVRWKEMRRTWQLLGFGFSTPIQKYKKSFPQRSAT